MRAVVVQSPGGTEVLSVGTRPVPEPAAGDLLIDVAAAGVNFIDVYHRQGIYPMPTPFVLGVEGAGTVVAIGDDTAEFGVGDRVAWCSVPGSQAERAVVPAVRAVPVPDGVAFDVAAAAMLQGMTAHYLVNSTYAVQPGDAVLVHAAAGGVGQLLVQMAAAKGARVIATASTEHKRNKARAAGAGAVVDYTRHDDPQSLADAVRAANEGAGVRVAYDGVGRATFEASLRSLAPRGMVALFGGASGQVEPLDLMRLSQLGSLFVTRPTLVHYTATREELLDRAADVFGQLTAGALQIEIGGHYDLDDAARAYHDLEGRRTTGKLILVP